MARYESPKDPLGYETTDSGYLLQMARDALCGRHQADVDAEADRIADALSKPRIQRTLRRRLKRWFSYRYWRVRFWLEDNFLQGRWRPFRPKD
jgi:hypothetical protein